MSKFLIALCLMISAALVSFVVFDFQSNANTSYATPTEAPLPYSPIQRCMNMGGALEAPVEGEWGYRIRKRDFDILKASGFDTVRIPIKWSAHAAQRSPYKLDADNLRRVRQVVDQATGAGLKAIINVHHYDALNENAETHLPRFMAIWEQIIEAFQFAPDTVLFEFLNEPHTDITYQRVNEINRQLLAKVRAVNPDRWVILGGGQWGTLEGLTNTDPPYDAHAIVTFHYYSPFEFTHQGALWAHKKVPLGQRWGTANERRDIIKDFAKAAKWRDKVGMPMFLGEFGVYEEVPNYQRAEWTEFVRSTAEQMGFSWCYWDYATSLGVYDLPNERFEPGMLDALIPAHSIVLH